MFEIKIDDAKYWKNCVDSIVSLIDEGIFNISKEGISLRAMDPSGISMVYFSIPNKAFSKYDVEKTVSVGLNIENFSKILASSRAAEQLIMKDSNNKFVVEFVGKNSRRKYRLPMIDIKKEAEKEPKVEFDSTVEVRADALKEILKDVNILSTHVGFKTDKNNFQVVAKGDSMDLEEEHLDNADLIKKLDVTKPASATFNLDYLERMITACPSNSTMTLSIGNENPIKVEYRIGDAQVNYLLAPYMEQ